MFCFIVEIYNQEVLLFLQTVKGIGMQDPRNGASDALSETGASSQESTVKQEDLNKMKEEITTELRQLRINIEKDRDQDRLELQVLQRKHTELQENFSSMHGEKDNLVKELTNVTTTVNELKTQMQEREKEFLDLKQKNKELRLQLEAKANDLQKIINQKEKEREELVKALKVKDTEYKKLQAMLETLKTDHEDRLNRLKNVNKEKFKLEKDVQFLLKEKKNLETKINTMSENIRALQETHSREAGNITQELEKQKTLLEEKERERADLEKRLEESVRENENLKMRNLKLEDCLKKSQDEKAHLQTRVRAHDMSSYAIPPFLVGGKSNRPGWRPSNSRNIKKS